MHHSYAQIPLALVTLCHVKEVTHRHFWRAANLGMLIPFKSAGP